MRFLLVIGPVTYGLTSRSMTHGGIAASWFASCRCRWVTFLLVRSGRGDPVQRVGRRCAVAGTMLGVPMVYGGVQGSQGYCPGTGWPGDVLQGRTAPSEAVVEGPSSGMRCCDALGRAASRHWMPTGTRPTKPRRIIKYMRNNGQFSDQRPN